MSVICGHAVNAASMPQGRLNSHPWLFSLGIEQTVRKSAGSKQGAVKKQKDFFPAVGNPFPTGCILLSHSGIVLREAEISGREK